MLALVMDCPADGDREELEEFHKLQLADARSRYEQARTAESKRAYLDALGRFADVVRNGKTWAGHSFSISFDNQSE
jgi:hypothetical protein